MQQIETVSMPAQIQQIKAMLMGSTFSTEVCSVHNKRLQHVNGIDVCWLCEADKLTAETSRQMHEQLTKHRAKKQYSTLHHDSVLTDETLRHATFDTYTENVLPGTEEFKNKQQAMQACDDYRRSGEVFNTFLTGDTGVGKSHLAMAMLHELNETDGQHRSCVFIDIDEALRRVRGSYSDKESTFTEHYVVDLMSNADYLVIDDIGAEVGNIKTDKSASDFVNRVLRAVLNARQNKSTIITTNLTRAQLEAMYDKKLVSRMMRNVQLIKFEQASDKRVRRRG
ncbi:MAG: ATP-binding protein [Caryophanon sp.]|nr:ATP-binding protein [Caryophanon sp.]